MCGKIQNHAVILILSRAHAYTTNLGQQSLLEAYFIKAQGLSGHYFVPRPRHSLDLTMRGLVHLPSAELFHAGCVGDGSRGNTVATDAKLT